MNDLIYKASVNAAISEHLRLAARCAKRIRVNNKNQSLCKELRKLEKMHLAVAEYIRLWSKHLDKRDRESALPRKDLT